MAYGIFYQSWNISKTTENLLQSIACVIERVDDILVTGKGNSDHLQNFETVFRKLATAGLKLRKESWKFMQSEVVHGGYVVNGEEIKPMVDRVLAIQKAPESTNMS